MSSGCTGTALAHLAPSFLAPEFDDKTANHRALVHAVLEALQEQEAETEAPSRSS